MKNKDISNKQKTEIKAAFAQDEVIASEISKRVYGYDAYTEEYFDLVK